MLSNCFWTALTLVSQKGLLPCVYARWHGADKPHARAGLEPLAVKEKDQEQKANTCAQLT